MFCSVCWKHPSVFVFSTTCKIRRHVFTTFNACIRNVKCKNKNVPEVLKSSKQISFFESRQSKILLFVMRVAAFFWVLTVHHPVVFVMTTSSATTNLFWRRFFFSLDKWILCSDNQNLQSSCLMDKRSEKKVFYSVRHHFARKPVVVLRNVGCFLRLRNLLISGSKWYNFEKPVVMKSFTATKHPQLKWAINHCCFHWIICCLLNSLF